MGVERAFHALILEIERAFDQFRARENVFRAAHQGMHQFELDARQFDHLTIERQLPPRRIEAQAFVRQDALALILSRHRPLLRRSTERTRATTSRGLKGLVM